MIKKYKSCILIIYIQLWMVIENLLFWAPKKKWNYYCWLCLLCVFIKEIRFLIPFFLSCKIQMDYNSSQQPLTSDEPYIVPWKQFFFFSFFFTNTYVIFWGGLLKIYNIYIFLIIKLQKLTFIDQVHKILFHIVKRKQFGHQKASLLR